MKEKLNFSQSLTIKGGVMYKKVLALLLVCFFGISNICGAATLASFSLVDNLALQSFLNNNAPEGQEMRDNFVTMLELLTGQKYADDVDAVAAINQLWEANTSKETRLGALKAKGVTIDNGEIKLNGATVGRVNPEAENVLTVSEAEFEILVQNLEQGKATIGNDVSNEALNARAENLHATGRALIADQPAIVANWINIWEANVAQATLTAQEAASEKAAIEDARAKLANGNILIGEAQVTDPERFVIEAHKGIGLPGGQVTLAKEWLDADEKVGADMLGHAFRVEKNGMVGHRAALRESAVQAKISGKETMAATKAAAREMINTAAAKVQTEADGIVATVNADEIRKGGKAATAEAEILKEKLPELAAVEPAQVVTIVTNILAGFHTDANNLTVAINDQAIKEIDNTTLTARIVDTLENGEKIGFYQSTLIQKYEDKWVGTFPGIKILQRLEEVASKSDSKLLQGSLNIIGVNAADVAAIKADLKAQYPSLFEKGIAVVRGTTERQLLADGTFVAGRTTVAFSNEEITGVDGIDYVHVNDVQKTNGLKLLALVLAPRGEKITGTHQNILADIQDGTLETPDLTVADEAVYTAMFDNYLQAIVLHTKA